MDKNYENAYNTYNTINKHTETGPRGRAPLAGPGPLPHGARKETNGVSTNGVTANFMFFDRGTFCVLLLTYFYLPKSARAYFFSPMCQKKLLLQRPH